jgi:hypothetical protein
MSFPSTEWGSPDAGGVGTDDSDARPARSVEFATSRSNALMKIPLLYWKKAACGAFFGH